MDISEVSVKLAGWSASMGGDVAAGLDRATAVARGYAVVFMQGHGGQGKPHVRLWQTIEQVKAVQMGFGRWRSGLKAGGGGQVPYARIQEEGGTVHHPGVEGKLQVFEKDGKTVFTMKTRPHDITIRGLSYLSDSLQAAVPIAETEVRRSVVDGFTRAMGV